MATGERWDRVVLVGFMAAGKTAVGRRLAELLGWRFVDLDAEIERRAGQSMAAIFASRGEAGFRELESELTGDVAAQDQVVIATGGGWAAEPGRLELLPPRSAMVWLRVPIEEALRRAAAEGPTRPLLDAPDRQQRAEALLRRREPSYARASFVVETAGRDVDAIAREIRELLVD